jgi:hypothetical protein
MSKPVAVISGDIHYSLNNLTLADKATRLAITKANELDVPFIANGDTTDTKANLRGECVNAMIETFKTAVKKPYVNIGNHCKINAKSIEHSLNFLRPYAKVIEVPEYVEELNYHVIPYHDDVDTLRKYLKTLPKHSSMLVHQGLEGANLGDYILDKSALNRSDVAGHSVVASHYHARQEIKLPDNGVWNFIGAPYSMSFGETKDPEKGFQVLYDDGSLEFIPTNLRKHVIVEGLATKYVLELKPSAEINKGDLVWVKVRGSKEDLAKCTREVIATRIGITDFKLDKFPDAVESTSRPMNMTQSEILDSTIQGLTQVSEECKVRLKDLWKGLA